jgi:hypothetical protein
MIDEKPEAAGGSIRDKTAVLKDVIKTVVYQSLSSCRTHGRMDVDVQHTVLMACKIYLVPDQSPAYGGL